MARSQARKKAVPQGLRRNPIVDVGAILRKLEKHGGDALTDDEHATLEYALTEGLMSDADVDRYMREFERDLVSPSTGPMRLVLPRDLEGPFRDLEGPFAENIYRYRGATIKVSGPETGGTWRATVVLGALRHEAVGQSEDVVLGDAIVWILEKTLPEEGGLMLSNAEDEQEEKLEITVERLAKMFALPDYDSIEEWNHEAIWDASRYAYTRAQSEGLSEEESEAAQQEAEEGAQHRLYRAWQNAVEYAAEQIFKEHDLELVSVQGREGAYWVAPESTWYEAARHIATTIDGVGMVDSAFAEEIGDVPDAEREEAAEEYVMENLGWMSSYPEVYGGPTAMRMYEHGWSDPF